MVIFENECIRAAIEEQWPKTRSAIIRYLMLPSLIFLLIYVVYTTFMFEMDHVFFEEFPQYTEKPFWWKALYRSTQAIYMLFLLYFVSIEGIQMRQGIALYFRSPWNFLDIIGLAFNLITAFMDFTNTNPRIQRPFFAVAVLLLWIRNQYYLRTFRSIGYLTSTIIKVVADMWSFVVIMTVTILAFGNAFYIISNNNEEKDRFAGESFYAGFGFSYNLMLGEFDTNEFGKKDVWLVWILFILASIFLIVIMLNLLIAIISATFEGVQDNAVNNMYKELASLIDDNDWLTSASDSKKYLLIAKPDNEQMEAQPEKAK